MESESANCPQTGAAVFTKNKIQIPQATRYIDKIELVINKENDRFPQAQNPTHFIMSFFIESLIRFSYSLAIIFLMSRWLYYPFRGKREFVLSHVMMSAMVFLMCILIKRVDLGVGFAIGIFAIFGIIRYRTQPIPVREMTYLFLAVGIAAKNALMPIDVEEYKLLTTDVLVLVITAGMELLFIRSHTRNKRVVYTNLELVKPSKREELLADLKNEFGIDQVKKIRLGKIDMSKHLVHLDVTFIDTSDSHATED